MPPPPGEFGRWLGEVSPEFNWSWRHLVHIRTYLDRVSSGEIKRLMVFLGPQHGKSEMCTVRYPAFRLERNPRLRVGIVSYNQQHANRFSRKARKIVRTRIPLSDERKAAGEWETAAGGTFLAVGAKGGITGNPVDLLLVDDSIKNREEAESEAKRERIWDAWTNDIYTRLQPDAAAIMINTRWRDDDLPGRILASEDGPSWTVINLPAFAEENDPLGRAIDEPLCPERFSREELEARRRVLGNDFYALYQGRPQPRGGTIIPRAGLSHIMPGSPRVMARVRYFDKAATEGGGAYSSGVLMGRDRDGLIWIEDVVRGQWSASARNAVMLATAKMDRQTRGRVVNVVEQEPGSGGKESAEITAKLLAGFEVRLDKVTGDKVSRILPFASQVQVGNVRLVDGPWNHAYVEELVGFPRGRYRDQADATSGAFNHLVNEPLDVKVHVPAGGGSLIDEAMNRRW